ncbi:MAG TPA: hypothetical protein VLG67_04885 [Candidatus Saccharimonadales bacterium]|nr:hypothetical protein [Candidatus Saccharimonadales bacterium]
METNSGKRTPDRRITVKFTDTNMRTLRNSVAVVDAVRTIMHRNIADGVWREEDATRLAEGLGRRIETPGQAKRIIRTAERIRSGRNRRLI